MTTVLTKIFNEAIYQPPDIVTYTPERKEISYEYKLISTVQYQQGVGNSDDLSVHLTNGQFYVLNNDSGVVSFLGTTTSNNVEEIITERIIPASTITVRPDPINIIDRLIGWNASAITSDAISHDGQFSFKATTDSVGIICGLNSPKGIDYSGYLDMTHGFYLSRGQFKIIERGIYKSSNAHYNADDVFHIAREGEDVIYLINNAVVYRSDIRSLGDISLDVSLYFSGDSVIDVSSNSTGVSIFAEPVNFNADQSIDVSSYIINANVISFPVHISSKFDLSAEHLVSRVSSAFFQSNFNVSIDSVIVGNDKLYQGLSEFKSSFNVSVDRNASFAHGSIKRVASFASDSANAQAFGVINRVISSAGGGFITIGVGSSIGYINRATSYSMGITGETNYNTPQYITRASSMGSDHGYAEGIGVVNRATSLSGVLPETASGAVKISYKVGLKTLQGSGILLTDGVSILTAAHVVADMINLSSISIDFNGDAEGLFVNSVIVNSIIHPDYSSFELGNDIAIIQLRDPISEAFVLRHDIYKGTQEEKQIFSLTSYSPRINPSTGAVLPAGWDTVSNKIDSISTQSAPLDSLLAFDFDNGTALNDASAFIGWGNDTGVNNEGFISPGDSGGGLIVNNEITGIVSYAVSIGAPPDVSQGTNFTYGEVGFATRVSSYSDFIDSNIIPDLILTPSSVSVDIDGGFTTSILAVVKYQSPNSVEISSFNTSVESYTGAQSTVSGFDLSIISSVTMPNYLVANLDGFTTSILAKVDNGSLNEANLGITLVKTIDAKTGAIADVSSFSSAIFSSTTLGAIASVDVKGFITQVQATVSQDDYAVATIDLPLISSVWGRAELSGFNTLIHAEVNGEVNNAVTYAINIKSSETTQYTNYNFDYIIKITGSYYGVRSDGLYLLDGANDNGTAISARIKTAESDFGTAKLKRLPLTYLDSDNTTSITPYVDGVASGSFVSNFGGARTKMGRGAKGRYWALEVSNVNGNDFKLKSLEMFAQVLSRKV